MEGGGKKEEGGGEGGAGGEDEAGRGLEEVALQAMATPMHGGENSGKLQLCI